MALNNTIRRAASRVVPLAARVLGAAPRYNYHSHASALFATLDRRSDLSSVLFNRSFPSALRSFSARPATDETLLQVLKDEITYAEESDENINKVSSSLFSPSLLLSLFLLKEKIM